MGWKKVEVGLKSAPLQRGVYFVGISCGGGRVRVLYIGSTHTQSNLRATFQQLFSIGGQTQIDPWDTELRSFLIGTSRKHLLIDWVPLKFPQDVVGDYVLDTVKMTGLLPRFNPKSEFSWAKKDHPFLQY
ncbi:uncharacterized protein LOC134848299 [Symsagittifera roscoffensis]|uniref:uncharacterized protein LOC134848299 n=1 Tax=Symsagittifera roscoffensis TaxID=84072 RepID=UPI00307C6FEE